MSGEWVPGLISLILILVLGLIVPTVMAPYSDLGYDRDNIFSGLLSFIKNGYEINFVVWTFNLDFFGLFGETLRGGLVDYFSALLYIPNYISIPLVLIIAFGIIYTILKLIRG